MRNLCKNRKISKPPINGNWLIERIFSADASIPHSTPIIDYSKDEKLSNTKILMQIQSFELFVGLAPNQN